MKNLLIVSSLLLTTSLFAARAEQKIDSFTVTEVSEAEFKRHNGDTGYGMKGIVGGITDGGSNSGFNTGGFTTAGVNGGNNGGTGRPTFSDRAGTAGQIISVARDIVALGESIYNLVQKGKPTNVTEYAPISVVPKDQATKEPVDLFDLEGFSMPVEKNFIAKVKSGDKQPVSFAYKVMYSYGGSYNGAGKYLTNVIIIPGAVKTSYGWDFNATMKLSGMMNHGTKADPIAGIMVTVKYQMNSWSNAYERNDTIHITGAGELKNHMAE